VTVRRLRPAETAFTPIKELHMPGWTSGRGARWWLLLLAFALLSPLFAGPASTFAQDETGGPDISPEFYDPPACSPAGSNGLILYQSFNRDRTAGTQGLVVADASGQRQRVVPLDGYPIRVLPTPYPNHAIVITGDAEGNANQIEVVDAGHAFRYPLDIPADVIGSLTYPVPATASSQGSRYIVLSDAQQRVAYLVDLENGTLTDIMAIAEKRAGDESLTLTAAIVAPDDQTLVLATNANALLIPTEKPNGDRLIAEGADMAGFTYLDNDPTQVLFSRKLDDGSSDIVLYDVTRFSERIVTNASDLLAMKPLPNGEAVLVATPDSLTLIDFDYLAKADLGDPGGTIDTIFVAPKSGRAAYSVTTASGEQDWRYVNLRTGVTSDLQYIDGLQATPGLGLPRWILFAPDTVVAASQGGTVFYALDLETGGVVQTLSSSSGTSYLPAIVSPGNGRYALVPSVTGSTQRYDVLDNRTGVTGELIDGRANAAVLSPDGCKAAVALSVGDADSREVRIAIITLDRSAAPITGELGFAPVWLVGS
jgi:hypothetical protein